MSEFRKKYTKETGNPAFEYGDCGIEEWDNRYVEYLEQSLKDNEKQLQELKDSIRNLETYDIEELPGNPYESYRDMRPQKKPLKDEYCGEFVAVEELKELLEDVEKEGKEK